MNIHIEPVLFQLRRKLGLVEKLEQVVDKTWEVSSGGERRFPQAVFLKKHLDLNLMPVGGISLETEMKRINGGCVSVKPTIAYQLSNVKILDGFLYKQRFRLKFKVEKEPLSNIFGDVERIEEGALVTQWSSNRYFGHWLHDEVPRTFAANDLGLQAYRGGKEKFMHQPGYERLLNLKVETVTRALFSKLVLFSDSTLNPYRIERFQRARSLLYDTVGSYQQNRYIYLSRGVTGAKGRELVNELALIDKLKGLGFVIVEPEGLSSEQIVEACLGAEIVMGIEGSAIGHGFFSIKDGGIVICIIPEKHFNNAYMDYCSAIGVQYGFLVSRAVPEGFSINLDDVDELFSKI
jgi:hypothetical protein